MPSTPASPIDLARHGYQPAHLPGLWTRTERPSDRFTYNDGDEYEAWVGQMVRDATDVSVLSRELQAGIKDWPSRYHLSAHRANIVQPFLDTMTGPVLEIGAGMGAVTRALGEHGLDVVAVEGSPRRAAICADRCRDLPNVQVVHDTVQGFGTGTEFGTIVVIGVLEYSRVHGFAAVDGRDPVDLMIEHLAGLLSPGGSLVLAIENQLGLKYFAGYPEDHVGRRMFGTEDRYGPDTVVTFGRAELSGRLAAAGLEAQDWYFPFPDYKLPTAVISERVSTVASGLDVTPLVTSSVRGDHQRPTTTVMHLERAWPVITRNGLLPDLSNSFLVRASAAPVSVPTPVAWYYGANLRRPEFAKVTTFEPTDVGFTVRRVRAAPTAAETVSGIGMHLEDEDYRPGRLWIQELEQVLGRPGWEIDQVATWAHTWMEALRAAAQTDEGHDDPVVAGNLIDAVPRNLVVEGDRSVFIDLEWFSIEPVPLSYVVFRALYDTLASLSPVSAPVDGTPLVLRELIVTLAEREGVRLDDERIHAHWERERTFQSTVIGAAIHTTVDEALGTSLRLHGDLDAIIRDAENLDGALRELGSVRAQLDTAVAVEAELRDEIERRGVEISRLAVAEATSEPAQQAVADSTAAALAELRRELSEHRNEVLDLHEDRAAQLTHLHRQRANDAARLSTELTEAVSLTEELAQVRDELAAVRATVSWRITRPLRGARHVARAPGAFARRAVHRLRRTVFRPAATPASPRVAEPTAVPEALMAPLDNDYYRRRHPDLDAMSPAEADQHYRLFGHVEGRAALPLYRTSATVRNAYDRERGTVLVLFHDATRTGAPVLGWNLLNELGQQYNTVAVLLDGGEISHAVEEVATVTVHLDRTRPFDGFEADLFAQGLRDDFSALYAVANSAATYPLACALERNGVPVVGLVHEFASSMRPVGVLAEYFETVSEVVFPAPIVAESMKREYAALLGRSHHIAPQGKCQLPPSDESGAPVIPRTTSRGPDGVLTDLPERTLDDLLAQLPDETVLVIGAGTISSRKGVEFFVQAADRVRLERPEAQVVFAWIGHRVPALQWYVDELWEQVRRSELTSEVVFLAPVSDMAPLYERADLFLLSSRLDPLPNVTIDAALAGVPVIAFDRASGFAEWLREDAALAELVVPHLDADGAGSTIARLAADPVKRAQLGSAIRESAGRAFQLAGYAHRVDQLGQAARDAVDRAERDIADIEASGAFSPHLFAGADSDTSTRALIGRYVTSSRLAVPRARPRAGLLVRRPTEGFNPLVYAEQAEAYDDQRDGDPFADYLRRGEPSGPWRNRVLRPTDTYSLPDESAPLRVLVHGHYHYPELVPELVSRIGSTDLPVTVCLTTSSEEKAVQIHQELDAAGAVIDRYEVRVVPNRGRDLAPLLLGVGADTVAQHDLLVHVHGKRSPHVDDVMARRWSDFIFENLLGGRTRMFDRIYAAFVDDARLGLVYPEDPHLNDWDLNRADAERLAARVGIHSPLPNHFDFPVGNMYWARTEAIRPLFDAGFTRDEFPEEPLPIDGTVLHALERLTPFIVHDAGFTAAKTVVQGISR